MMVITRLARELRQLATRPPEGIKFIPNEEDSIAEIFAEIDGPVGTPYEGGTFRMKLVLSSDFPQSPPRGFFLTRIYHPNVAVNGDICVNTLKRDWSPTLGVAHVLQVVRCLLIIPFPESSLNEEAGRLFMESYDEYARRARLMTSVHAASAAAACAVAASADPAAAADDGPSEPAADVANDPAAVADPPRADAAGATAAQKKAKKSRKKALRRL